MASPTCIPGKYTVRSLLTGSNPELMLPTTPTISGLSDGRPPLPSRRERPTALPSGSGSRQAVAHQHDGGRAPASDHEKSRPRSSGMPTVWNLERRIHKSQSLPPVPRLTTRPAHTQGTFAREPSRNLAVPTDITRRRADALDQLAIVAGLVQFAVTAGGRRQPHRQYVIRAVPIDVFERGCASGPTGCTRTRRPNMRCNWSTWSACANRYVARVTLRAVPSIGERRVAIRTGMAVITSATSITMPTAAAIACSVRR